MTEAIEITARFGFGHKVSYVAGHVADVLPTDDGSFDMIHDDAWFAKAPTTLRSCLACSVLAAS